MPRGARRNASARLERAGRRGTRPGIRPARGRASRPPLREGLEAAHGHDRPALVARAAPASGVAAEGLGEGDQVAPVGVVAEAAVAAVARPAAVGARDEQGGEPPRELARDLPEVHHAPGPGRALDAEAVAIEVVIALERL